MHMKYLSSYINHIMQLRKKRKIFIVYVSHDNSFFFLNFFFYLKIKLQSD